VEIVEQVRPALVARYAECLRRDRLDALVLPTTPLPARPVGHDDDVELNGRRVGTLAAYLRNTDPTAFAGLPSISVPAGCTASGLPVGLSFDGLPGADTSLLALAAAFEQLVGPMPPVAQSRQNSLPSGSAITM
jgi:mandelamide amidase